MTFMWSLCKVELLQLFSFYFLETHDFNQAFQLTSRLGRLVAVCHSMPMLNTSLHTSIELTTLKFNSSPLKNGGWKITFLLRRVTFQGHMLNFSGVYKCESCFTKDDVMSTSWQSQMTTGNFEAWQTGHWSCFAGAVRVQSLKGR